MAAIGKGSGKSALKRGGVNPSGHSNLKTGVNLPSIGGPSGPGGSGQLPVTGRTGKGKMGNSGPGGPGKA